MPVSSKQATKIVKWDVGSLSTEMPGHACDTDDLLDTPVMQSALKQSVYQDQAGRILAVRQAEHLPTLQEGTNSGPSEDEQVKYLENLTKSQPDPSTQQTTKTSKQSRVNVSTARIRKGRPDAVPAPGVNLPMPEIAQHFTTIIQVNGRDAVALIDSGATGNMLSPLFASLADISPTQDSSPMAATIADGSSHTCAGTAMSVSVRMGKLGRTMKSTEDFFIPNMHLPSGFDIILGLHWFQKWRPVFDWQPPMSATISTGQGTVKL
jgi:hypothetical protein